MALAVLGTQSNLTLTASEQTVGAAVTTVKTVVCQIDLVNMAAGDVVELYCYVKTAGTGGTARLYFKQAFANAQGQPVYQSVPVPAMYSVEFKLKQPTGTGRVVDYVLLSID
jgi:hypothetical protein